MMSFKEIMELMTSNTLTPDIPVPVDPDFQNPLDPTTWNGIPSDITESQALNALECMDRLYD